MSRNKELSAQTKKMCGMAMFIALSVAASFLTGWIDIQHLTFDAKDAVITIAAYIYGPVPAVIMSVISASLESLISGFKTGPYGWLMDIVSSATFAFTAGLIYKRKRSFNGALISLSAASAVLVGVMMLFNMIIAPLFFGLKPFDPFVMTQIPVLYLPFNIAKALMNSAIVMYLYKPVTFALTKAKLLDGGDKGSLSFNKNSLIIIISGVVALAISIALFLVLHFGLLG